MRLLLLVPLLLGALPAPKYVPPGGTPTNRSGTKYITPEDVNGIIGHVSGWVVAECGNVDDTAALNSLATSAATAKKRLVIPKDATCAVNGVGTVSGNDSSGGLVLPADSDLDLRGTLRVIPNASHAYNAVLVKNGDRVRIHGGGTIQCDREEHTYGGAKPTHEWGYGININGSRDVTVDGVSVLGCTGDAIMVSPIGLFGAPGYVPSERVRIANNRLDGSRRNNLSITGAEGVMVEGNVITRAGYHDGVADGTAPKFGIDIEGYGEGAIDYEKPLGVTVRGNSLSGNVSASLSNFSGYGVIVADNISDNVISYGYGADMTISGNVFKEGAAQRSVAIASVGTSQGFDANTVVISGNVVHGFETGVDVRGRNVTVSGNQLYRQRGNAVSIYGAFPDASPWIEAATYVLGQPAQVDGVWYVSTTADNIGNLPSATSTAWEPYYPTSSVLVSGNYVFKPGVRGISAQLAAGAIGRLVVSDNVIENAASGEGIYSAAASATIRGNRLTRCRTGIRITGGDAVVSGNYLSPASVASEAASIAVEGAATVGVVKGNTIRGASASAIVGQTNPAVKVLQNDVLGFTGAVAAISVTSTNRVEVSGNTVTHARASNMGYGIIVSGSTGALVIGNAVVPENAYTLTNPIKTDGASASRVINNVTSTGTLATHASDTVEGNVAF